jgi:hypothetical protein
LTVRPLQAGKINKRSILIDVTGFRIFKSDKNKTQHKQNGLKKYSSPQTAHSKNEVNTNDKPQKNTPHSFLNKQ